MKTCDLFWGSHGCDLELGHEGLHICGVNDPDGICSEFDETEQKMRFIFENGTPGKWWHESKSFRVD